MATTKVKWKLKHLHEVTLVLNPLEKHLKSATREITKL